MDPVSAAGRRCSRHVLIQIGSDSRNCRLDFNRFKSTNQQSAVWAGPNHVTLNKEAGKRRKDLDWRQSYDFISFHKPPASFDPLGDRGGRGGGASGIGNFHPEAVSS